MGIYDYVHCEYPLPGLDDPTKIEFQTKSLDTLFDNYRITAEGKLEIEEYDVEDRSDPNAEGFARFIGCCARVPTGWKPVDFSGILNFYGDVYSGNLMLISFEWFEFDAEFKNGTLTNLSRVEEIRYE
jgi:hypothetical protein